MKWQGGRRSSNIEDRRGMRPRGGLVGGGISTIIIIIIALYFGVDPSFLVEGMQSSNVSTSGTQPTADDLRNDPLADMIAVVIADTEDVWGELFANQGRR